MSQTVVLRVLPSDERGARPVRVCWFMRTPDGPIHEPSGEIKVGKATIAHEGGIGRIACQPTRRSALPHRKAGEVHLCIRSDDPRPVNCPECKATPEFQAAMAVYENTETVGV